MKLFKKVATIAIAVVSLSALTATIGLANGVLKTAHKHGFKNVIVMIPDGCDETAQTAARWFKGEDLQLDKMQNTAVKIHMANSIITGSAAAATAFACGHKTTVGFLGVGPRTDDLLTGFVPTAQPYAPVASILEAAKLKGMATGIAVTSRVTHATPAAFACHIHDREMDNEIMEHMVYDNVDVVFGGGKRHLLPGDSCPNAVDGGKRTDCENLLDVLTDRGYQFVESRDDMLALTSGKAWGLFNPSHMQPDMDRQYFAPQEPSLAEMVSKAIELLSQDKDGFFLMVEGSQVDWAGHNNDPIYMITDFIAFDDAVKAACDFARKDGETLVLAYPDHNTGGMKIGHHFTQMGYTETTIEDLVDPLKGMTMTANGVVAKMEGDYSAQNIKAKIQQYWNITATDEEINEILAEEPSVGLSYALAKIISKYHTVIGWTTHGHNGETVPVWVYGDDAPVGTIDNTELALIAANAMNTNLDIVSDLLYVDLDEVTSDYIIEDDGLGNQTIKIGDAQMPVSKDYMIIDGKTIQLPGLTVYAPVTGKVYVSKKALIILSLY